MADAHKNVTAALIRVQSAINPILPAGRGHHGPYITLKQIYDELKPLWKQEGLAVYQRPVGDGGCVVETVICHAETGEEIVSRISIPMQRQNDPTAFGGALSYGMRYALKCLFGIVEADDDDDAAGASVTLEKLLRGLDECKTLLELEEVKTAASRSGYLSDRFWQRTYALVYRAKGQQLQEQVAE